MSDLHLKVHDCIQHAASVPAIIATIYTLQKTNHRHNHPQP